jgi:hypothetical protein
MRKILMEAQFAEANARLLNQLEKQTGAAGLGAICGFFAVEASWRCPCCYRLKAEIVRLDKNDNLCCPVVEHHDHFEECVAKIIDYRGIGTLARQSLDQSFVRFQPTMICGDCNVAEPVAKAIVEAPAAFSFTPYEIATFIDVTLNRPHVVDPDRAALAYKAAEPAMNLLGNKLRALREIVKVKDGDKDAWEPLAGPAWRVIKDARRNMKAK